MKKFTIAWLAVAVVYLLLPGIAHASLIEIKSDGQLIVNVLGSEDSLQIPKKESLQIKDIAANIPGNGAVSLVQENGKINLSVATSDGEKNLDVTNYKDSLIQIEERDKAKQIQIGLLDGKFSIEEGGVIALTDFPINIDPKNAEISVLAPSGSRYLAVLPFEAYQNLVKARIISQLGDEKLTILETAAGQISYNIPGQKVINIFNVISYPVDVATTVSASTGEVLSIDEPIWLKFINLFLVEGVKA